MHPLNRVTLPTTIPLLNTLTMGDKKGKGYWKFPDFLLTDSAFKAVLQDRIRHVVVHNKNADPGLLWDVIKMCV